MNPLFPSRPLLCPAGGGGGGQQSQRGAAVLDYLSPSFRPCLRRLYLLLVSDDSAVKTFLMCVTSAEVLKKKKKKKFEGKDGRGEEGVSCLRQRVITGLPWARFHVVDYPQM